MFSKLTMTLAVLITLSACHKEDESHEEHFKGLEVGVREQGVEFEMPAKIWDLLLRDAVAEAKAAESKKAAGEGGGHGGGGATAEAELTTASFLYVPVTVELKEKTPGVLREPAIRIRLADGGGEIDLSKWTTGKNGTFYVRFLGEWQDATATEARAYFYSRTKKRKVGDDVIGAGCKQFLDMSSTVMNPQFQGFAVNTTRNFHTTVLGGHFLLSWMNETSRKVTHVTFKDTENPDYFCEKETK